MAFSPVVMVCNGFGGVRPIFNSIIGFAGVKNSAWDSFRIGEDLLEFWMGDDFLEFWMGEDFLEFWMGEDYLESFWRMGEEILEPGDYLFGEEIFDSG